MPSDKPKYSGLLDESQVEILNQFCQVHGVSKSQAIGIFLDQWNKSGQPELTINEMTFDENKVIYLVTDLVHTLLEDPVIIKRLASNEDFIQEVSSRIATQSSTHREFSEIVTSNRQFLQEVASDPKFSQEVTRQEKIDTVSSAEETRPKNITS